VSHNSVAKLSPALTAKARRHLEDGERAQNVAALFNVERSTLYRALQRESV